MAGVGTIVGPDALHVSRSALLGIAGAVVARAIHVVHAVLTVHEFAQAVTIANVVSAAHGSVIGHSKRDVGARALVRIDAARFARSGARRIATNAIGAEQAVAFHSVGARFTHAFLAMHPAAIGARFVAVLHAVAA